MQWHTTVPNYYVNNYKYFITALCAKLVDNERLL